MELNTLYTAIPIDRIISIEKYGLLINDKLSTLEEFTEDNYLKGRIFDESTFGYIYASTDLHNAIEWGTIITMQIHQSFLILEYRVDKNIIEQDKCSPNRSILDVRFKGHVEAKDITVIMGKLSQPKNGKTEIIDIERKSLIDMCDQMEVRCESCNEITKYRDMEYLSNMLLCKTCEKEGREFAIKIGGEQFLREVELNSEGLEKNK